MGFFSNLFEQYATISPDDVPSYGTLGQLLSTAGYSGPVTENYSEMRDLGGDAGGAAMVGATRVNPAVQEWLTAKGYGLRQMQSGGKWSTAAVDANGNPIAQADYQEHGIPNILKYGVPAFLGAVAGGAGLTALGAAGGAGATGAGGAGVAGAAPAGAGTVAAGGAMADLSMAPELAALMGGSSVPVGSLGMGAGMAEGAAGIGSAATAGSWLSQLASGLTGGGGTAGGQGALGGYGGLISQLLNAGSGIYGMKLAGDAREASDPFAQYRPGYGAALANLESNPSQIQTRPGFQAGIEAINRNAASRGYGGSGNQVGALMRYSGDFYNQEANRLAQLAGAGQTPGAGQFGAADLASKSLGSIGYGVAPSTQPNYNSNQLLQLALSQLMRP